MLTLLVILQSLIPAVAGATIGALVGVAVAMGWDAVPPWSFVAGTVVLSVLTAVGAAVPPALLAATQDPVRVLRQP